MEVVQINEHGPWVPVDAPAAEIQALDALGVFEIDHHPGATRMRAGSHVGTVSAGSLQLHVAPKVGIPRLLFLLGFARDPTGWRDHHVELPEASGLLPAAAAALAVVCRQVLSGGVLQGYRRTEDRGPVLRGRLDEVAQISVGRGLAFPVNVIYDEYTVDIPENQILRTAMRRVMRLPGVAPVFTAELRRLDALLDEVAILPNGGRPPTLRWDRRNQRYRPAVALARLVLAATSWESGHGSVTAAGFLFDMNKVFEDFLSAALTVSLRRHGGAVLSQATSHLDEGNIVQIRPDIVWRDAGQARAVIDAKYKTHDSNADDYQIVAYCTALGSSNGHLVDAAGPAPATSTQIRKSPIRLHRWHLDLSTPPEELLLQIDALADRLAETTAG